jgi:hypothetical protein
MATMSGQTRDPAHSKPKTPLPYGPAGEARDDLAPRIVPHVGCRPAPTPTKNHSRETLRYISAGRATADLFPATIKVRVSSFEKQL